MGVVSSFATVPGEQSVNRATGKEEALDSRNSERPSALQYCAEGFSVIQKFGLGNGAHIDGGWP